MRLSLYTVLLVSTLSTVSAFVVPKTVTKGTAFVTPAQSCFNTYISSHQASILPTIHGVGS